MTVPDPTIQEPTDTSSDRLVDDRGPTSHPRTPEDGTILHGGGLVEALGDDARRRNRVLRLRSRRARAASKRGPLRLCTGCGGWISGRRRAQAAGAAVRDTRLRSRSSADEQVLFWPTADSEAVSGQLDGDASSRAHVAIVAVPS